MSKEKGAEVWTWIKRLVRPLLFVLFSLLIMTGQFDDFSGLGMGHYSLVALLLILVLLEVLELVSPAEDHRFRLFRLGLWTMLAVTIAVHAAGGPDSSLYPAVYLAFGVLAGVLRPGYAALLGAVVLGLEGGWILLQMPGEGAWSRLGIHGAFLALFGAGVGVFVHTERRSKTRALQVLEHFEQDIHDFQKDDTVFKLSGLSESGRKREAARSVYALDEAFSSALSTGRQLLGADACVLYWRSSPDHDFHLREASTIRDQVDSESMVICGEGILGWCADQKESIRVSGRRRLKNAVPYLGSADVPLHLIAVPIVEDDWTAGILVADRSSEDEFSEDDEKLVRSISLQVIEIHEHALLVRRREAEASQWKALAELGHRLSRTLDLNEVLDSVMRTGQILSGFNAACVVLPSQETGAPVVVRAAGELDERLTGREPDLSETLVQWVLDEKQHLYIPDLESRDKRTPVLGRRADPSGMRSVLIHPLPLRKYSPGAMVFYSHLADAFSRHKVQTAGILADLAAVSIHNAMLHRETQKKAVTDGLTGLYNHRWFQERLGEEVERAGRLGHELAVIICDLDRFKRINDTYGHPVGDEVLKAVAQVLRESVRKVDSAARYGGEEFVLIMVGTGAEGAREFAERLRKKTGKLVFHASGKEFRVSLSLGISVYPSDGRYKEDLIELADEALYRAKQSGRNRAVLARQIAGRPTAVLGKSS
ncbi:MAG: diguanylate cyclase [bacterium]